MNSQRSATTPSPRADGQEEVEFRVLYAHHHREVWRYCLRRLANREEAEEVFNSTFTVAWQKFDEIPEGEGTRPWLFAVARNHYRNSHRKSQIRQRTQRRIQREPNANQHQAATDDIALGGTENVRQALGRLSDDDAELLMLAAWEELSHHEIGLTLGCSENAVAIRLHRARARLANELDDRTKAKSGKRLKDSPTPRHRDGVGTKLDGKDL